MAVAVGGEGKDAVRIVHLKGGGVDLCFQQVFPHLAAAELLAADQDAVDIVAVDILRIGEPVLRVAVAVGVDAAVVGDVVGNLLLRKALGRAVSLQGGVAGAFYADQIRQIAAPDVLGVHRLPRIGGAEGGVDVLAVIVDRFADDLVDRVLHLIRNGILGDNGRGGSALIVVAHIGVRRDGLCLERLLLEGRPHLRFHHASNNLRRGAADNLAVYLDGECSGAGCAALFLLLAAALFLDDPAGCLLLGIFLADVRVQPSQRQVVLQLAVELSGYALWRLLYVLRLYHLSVPPLVLLFIYCPACSAALSCASSGLVPPNSWYQISG